jgi:hypothetical protein
METGSLANIAVANLRTPQAANRFQRRFIESPKNRDPHWIRRQTSRFSMI